MQVGNGNEKRRPGRQSGDSHLGGGWRTVPGSCRPRKRETLSARAAASHVVPTGGHGLPQGRGFVRTGRSPPGESLPLPAPGGSGRRASPSGHPKVQTGGTGWQAPPALHRDREPGQRAPLPGELAGPWGRRGGSRSRVLHRNPCKPLPSVTDSLVIHLLKFSSAFRVNTFTKHLSQEN